MYTISFNRYNDVTVHVKAQNGVTWSEGETSNKRRGLELQRVKDWIQEDTL